MSLASWSLPRRPQDVYTDGHSRRVAAHAAMVARKMGLSGEEVAKVRAAAAVHDIGKVRVPRTVLDKPGKLTSAEFELVKAHAPWAPRSWLA
jgi:HD-GYP domain-containing protein (c-di-GMP phosphodiesterase class II)